MQHLREGLPARPGAQPAAVWKPGLSPGPASPPAPSGQRGCWGALLRASPLRALGRFSALTPQPGAAP